jgi:hypothetical protein
MSRFIVFVLTLVSAAALAQVTAPKQRPAWESDQHPTLVMPPLSALVQKVCDTHQPPQIGAVRQDPTNLYYTAKVYAGSRCPGAQSKFYEGCALVQWDPTGTSYTVQEIIYQRQDSSEHPTRVHGPARCLTETLAIG